MLHDEVVREGYIELIFNFFVVVVSNSLVLSTQIASAEDLFKTFIQQAGFNML